METNNYQEIRKKAEIFSKEKSVLSYFFSLCEGGALRYEGKQGKEHFFAHPHQRTGSIAVRDSKNKWYDHSQGVGGDIIYAIRHFEHKSFVEVVNAIDTATHSYKPPTEPKTASRTLELHVLHKSGQITHPVLIKYIHSRGLEPQHLSDIAKEIHWAKGGRKFFGLGFSNDNGGYSIRSGIFKFNIGPNTVSTIQIGNNPAGIKIFEGGFDLASYRKIDPSASYHAIVLNGLANLTHQYMEDISECAAELDYPVELYLDNDMAGDTKTAQAKEVIKMSEDKRGLYRNFQDLNDYLVSGQSRKIGR
jgi:hypothetical protein